MSEELTMKTKGIRGLIAALDVEKPDQPSAAIYKEHLRNVLTNDDGVPVMPIYRIVEVVLAAIGEDTDQVRQAIDVIARWALHNAAEKWIEDGWENLPDFCEADYMRVTDRMTELVPDVSLAEFEAAHRVLADRAGTTI